MTGSSRVLAVAVMVLALAPVSSAADVTLVGKPQVPTLVRGQRAEVAVTLRAAKEATKPVRLQVKIGDTLVGELAEAPLGANQTQTYKIGVTVPAGAAGPAVLSVLAWGEEVGRQRVSLQASAPRAMKAGPAGPAQIGAIHKAPASVAPRARAAAPSLTQTVATAAITLAGNRGASQGPAPPIPSLTQTVAPAAITLVGNRGAPQSPAPPVPSLTQAVPTAPITLAGDR